MLQSLAPVEQVNPFMPTVYDDFYGNFNAYNRELLRLIREALRLAPPSFLVELGSGSGLFTSAIDHILQPEHILAIDPNQDMLGRAGNISYNAKVDLVEGNGEDVERLMAPKHSPSVIIAKSSYHYFSDKLPIPDIVSLLAAGGYFIVIERTERSAYSYPLFEEGRRKWSGYFADQKRARIEAGHFPDCALSFGQKVLIPSALYYDVIKAQQLSFLWSFNADKITEWANQAAQTANAQTPFFEEYDVSIYQKTR